MCATWKRVSAVGALAVVCGFGSVAQAEMPKNMIFFVPGATCPSGTIRAADANGRLLLVANDPGAVGRTYGAPLRDKEDRTHHHSATVSATLPSHHIAGASSCCNSQATSQGAHSATFDTQDATSGLPFAQLLVCKVN
jgi:hypothetical protein